MSKYDAYLKQNKKTFKESEKCTKYLFNKGELKAFSNFC